MGNRDCQDVLTFVVTLFAIAALFAAVVVVLGRISIWMWMGH